MRKDNINNKSNLLKISAGFIFSLGFMALAFRKVNFSQMIDTVRGVNYFFLVIIFCLILLNEWLRSLRWQYFLMPIKRIDVGSLFSSLLIGYSANIILPAHLGEFIRAYVIGRKHNVASSSAFASIVTERIVDIFSLLIILVITLFVFPFPNWVNKSAYFMFLVTVLLLILLILLKNKTEHTLSFVSLFLKPFPGKFHIRVLNIFMRFLDGFVGLSNWKHYVIVFFLSIFIWISYALVFYFGFFAFNFHLPWIASVVLLIITSIAIVVPSSPGYFGTYHLLAQISLGLFGIAESPALAFAFVIHGVNTFPFFFIGLAFAWKEEISFSRMKASYGFEQRTNT